MRAAFAVLVLLLACGRDDAPRSTAAAYETVTTGLSVPWALAFAPDGRVFVAERRGSIRVLTGWQPDPEPWATLAVTATGEAGLLGIAVSPTFERDGHVVVVGTFAEADRLVNRVIRFREQAGRGVDPHVIIDDIPAAEFHAGAALAFGPDGMLYLTSGDAGDPGNARDLRSHSGKVLRYTPDGGIPDDNPFPGSPVYALGLRNVQGIAWTADGELLATDHGPSGFPNERFRRNRDELNRIMRGRNYGWPDEAGYSTDPALESPLVEWTPAIAPAGLAVYTGDFQPWRGSAFVSGLRGRQLRRIGLERWPAGGGDWRVSGEQVLFYEELGRLRAVTMGPDGFIYFTTSNWDGRGDPGPQDDRILRLLPR